MYTPMLAVGLVAAGVVVGAASARAADLYGPIPDRYSSAYEDPRYRDLYGPEPRPHYGQRYEQRFYHPVPPPPPPHVHSYKDDPDHRPPLRQFNHFDSGPNWRHERHGAACIPREEIRRGLIEEGWYAFRDLEIRGDVALVRARRPNGDVYDLKVDRCSGEVVHARVIERSVPGPYAHNAPYGWAPRRGDRPYY
jgi:hypothetical protein